MTNRFKDFGSGSADVNSAPLSFKLHGEEFFCKPAIQGKFLLSLVADSSSNDPDRSSKVVTDFFQKVLVKESAEKFDEILKSEDKIVTVETLAEITEWLMEAYTDRPNQQPEASSTGQ
jgi:hypothetical protein